MAQAAMAPRDAVISLFIVPPIELIVHGISQAVTIGKTQSST